jgi:tRNA(Arg) A34 adenosine deaminase TadA
MVTDKKRNKRRYTITATIMDKRGRIISKGKNSYTKTHPLQRKMAKLVGRPSAIYLHAEIAALVKLKSWAKAYKIRVERYDDDGNPRLAKPCPACLMALKNAGINVIEFTTD